jgi:hypothetical protein
MALFFCVFRQDGCDLPVVVGNQYGCHFFTPSTFDDPIITYLPVNAWQNVSFLKKQEPEKKKHIFATMA